MANYVTGIIILVIGLALGWSDCVRAAEQEMADWSFTKDGPYALKDGWTVYRDQIVAPQSLSPALCGTGPNAEPVTLPDVWGFLLTRSLSTGHGVATYCRRVELSDPEELFALQFGTIRSVSHIYVVTFEDGMSRAELLFKNGSLLPLGNEAVVNPAVPVLPLPYGKTSFSLVIQVSNNIHKQGGIVEVPEVGVRWRMAAEENRSTALPTALVLVLFFISMATFFAGYGRQTSMAHYFFAFLVFAAAVRAAFVSDIIWDYFPTFSLARKYDLEYLSLFLIQLAYYAFIHRLLRPGQWLMVDGIVYGSLSLLIIFALVFAPFFAPGTITLTREPVQLIGILIILMVLYAVLRASIKAEETRREALVIALSGVLYGSFELASVYGLIPAHLEWSQFIIFIAMLMHGHAFVLQARRMERERDSLTSRLADKNRDLQNRALALELARKEAEKASEAKSQFLSNFSHELRTPLNAIIGFSDLMSRQLLGKIGSPIYLEYIKDIHTSGRHLLALVDDILDLSRIEEGEDVLQLEAIDLVALAHETTAILQLLAKERSVTLIVDSEPGIPRIRADERRMRQVFINLVNNAIKFNVERGYVRISVRADDAGVYVDVKDTGLGIAEADLPLVLSRFGQVDAQKRSSGAGVGLGLPMCDALVRQHGGELIIGSTLGEGTQVHLFFPANLLVKDSPTGEFLPQ